MNKERQEQFNKGLLTEEEAKRLSYLDMRIEQYKFVQDQIEKALDIKL